MTLQELIDKLTELRDGVGLDPTLYKHMELRSVTVSITNSYYACIPIGQVTFTGQTVNLMAGYNNLNDQKLNPGESLSVGITQTTPGSAKPEASITTEE